MKNPFTMRDRMRGYLPLPVLIMFSLLFMSGCAALEKKFTPSKSANIGFFADNTIAMLSDVNLSFKRNEAVFVRRFFDENGTEEKRVDFLDNNMETALYNLLEYSVTLVNLTQSEKSERQKAAAYADYLINFKADILYGSNMTSANFDATIKEIRGQPDFLAALRAAQPIVNDAVIRAIMELKDLTRAIETVAGKMDAKIDIAYADVIRYQQKMEDEKSRILGAFEVIYDAYRSENPDLKKLSEGGAIWLPEIIPQGRPTRKELKTIGDHLRARLDALHAIQQEIQPYWEDYRASHRELDRLVDKSLAEVSKVRLILLVWVRAHQKMASGVVNPAEWFDINDTPKILLKLGTGVPL